MVIATKRWRSSNLCCSSAKSVMSHVCFEILKLIKSQTENMTQSSFRTSKSRQALSLWPPRTILVLVVGIFGCWSLPDLYVIPFDSFDAVYLGTPAGPATAGRGCTLRRASLVIGYEWASCIYGSLRFEPKKRCLESSDCRCQRMCCVVMLLFHNVIPFPQPTVTKAWAESGFQNQCHLSRTPCKMFHIAALRWSFRRLRHRRATCDRGDMTSRFKPHMFHPKIKDSKTSMKKTCPSKMSIRKAGNSHLLEIQGT